MYNVEVHQKVKSRHHRRDQSDFIIAKFIKKSKIDAVIVTEHRNLSEILLKDGAAVEHVIHDLS